MKKALTLALCLILAGLLAVNGAFALPDTDQVSKWFQNLTHLLGEVLGLPIADETQFNVSLVYPDGVQTALLFPGADLQQHIAVENAPQSSPAYFRIAIAVQESAWKHMDIQAGGEGYTWLPDWREIRIGEHPFMLMIATYQEALPAGERSKPFQLDVSMDTSVTTQQMSQISEDFLQIQVLAIDANAFQEAIDNNLIVPNQGQTMAEAVLDQALPIVDHFNPFE